MLNDQIVILRRERPGEKRAAPYPKVRVTEQLAKSRR
jgi:hypothetical protein